MKLVKNLFMKKQENRKIKQEKRESWKTDLIVQKVLSKETI